MQMRRTVCGWWNKYIGKLVLSILVGHTLEVFAPPKQVLQVLRYLHCQHVPL